MKPVVTHKSGATWQIHTTKPLIAAIHTWMPEKEQMLLLKELTLDNKDSIDIFPGEFLSYLTPFGVLSPVMRA